MAVRVRTGSASPILLTILPEEQRLWRYSFEFPWGATGRSVGEHMFLSIYTFPSGGIHILPRVVTNKKERAPFPHAY